MKKTTVVVVAEIIILCILIIYFIFGIVSDNKEPAKTSDANLNISDMKGTIPRVALTFDDGPSAKYTEKLLKGLKKRGVKATFFLTGERIAYSKKIVKRMKKDGHIIGNHTYTHIDLAKTGYNEAKKEIEDTNNAIMEITGERPKFLRPPYGDWDEKLLKETDMSIVLWSVDPEDWKDRNADVVAERVIKSTRPGDIILLHDIFGTSVDAAFKIVDELQSKGYHFVTVEQMEDSNSIKKQVVK